MDYFLVSCPCETNLPGINNQYESMLDGLSRNTRPHFMCSWFLKVLLRFPFIKLLIKHELHNDVRDIFITRWLALVFTLYLETTNISLTQCLVDVLLR